MTPTVYVAIKSKKLNEEFCSSIDKSNVAKVIDRFYTLKECREKMAIRTPGILLFGLDLQDRNNTWIAFFTEIQKKYPGLKILAVTSYDEYCIFKNSLNDLTSGYISKDALPVVIISAIKAIVEGKFFRYDKIVVPTEEPQSDSEWLTTSCRQMIKNIKTDDNNQETIEKLSQFIDAAEKYRMNMIKDLISKERDCLDDDCVDKYLKQLIENLLIKGHPNWEIADIVNVSDEVVRLHRLELILKLRGNNSIGYILNKNGKNIELGRRERQLLQLIAAGYTNEEVADNFFYQTIDTVKKNRNKMIEKFEAKNTMTMVISALRMGLIKLEDIEDLQ